MMGTHIKNKRKSFTTKEKRRFDRVFFRKYFYTDEELTLEDKIAKLPKLLQEVYNLGFPQEYNYYGAALSKLKEDNYPLEETSMFYEDLEEFINAKS